MHVCMMYVCEVIYMYPYTVYYIYTSIIIYAVLYYIIIYSNLPVQTTTVCLNKLNQILYHVTTCCKYTNSGVLPGCTVVAVLYPLTNVMTMTKIQQT